MKSRPIIFSAESVRAILEGRKTQTRRVIKPQPFIDDHGNFCSPLTANELKQKKRGTHNWGQGIDGKPWLKEFVKKCPFGVPGDRLWVREKYQKWNAVFANVFVDYLYAAEMPDEYVRENDWSNSMFMPKAASRITLEIVNVKVQRLQGISESDAEKEGCEVAEIPCTNQTLHSRIATFIDTWNKLNAERGFSWSSNPWVWVVEFRVAESKFCKE